MAIAYAGRVTRSDRPTRLLAACLAALAGYVDAIGFLSSGGLFVSFMSGNSTRLAVGAWRHAPVAGAAAALIGAFVAGVLAGALAGHAAGAGRRRAVLGLVAALLAGGALLGPARPPALLLLAAAMGAENAVFEADGEVRIGLTYMTGTLVRTGQRLALALRGGDRWGWAPHLLLWLGLVAGAWAGAAMHARLAAGALWPAVVAALALAAATGRDPDA